MALQSSRFWPLWIAGLQLTAILGHLLKAVDIGLFCRRLRRRTDVLGLSDRADPRGRYLAESVATEVKAKRGLLAAVAQSIFYRALRRVSRRKKSHQTHGTANRPRLWGKHAVAAALDNPERKVLRAWTTRETAGFMQFPKDVAVTLAEAPDLGRLVPHDAPHQGVVIEVEPLDDHGSTRLARRERAVLLVLDQVTDPHNVGAILRSAAAFGAIGIVTQDRHSPPESGELPRPRRARSSGAMGARRQPRPSARRDR